MKRHAEEPFMFGARYNNLKGADRLREYERDLTIYEQKEAIEELIEQNRLNIKKNNEIAEEQTKVMKERNKLLEEKNFLKYATNEQKEEYLRRKQEDYEAELKHKEYKRNLEIIRDDAKGLLSMYNKSEKVLKDCVYRKIKKVEFSSRIVEIIKALVILVIFIGGLMYSISTDNKILAAISIIIPLISIFIVDKVKPIYKNKINKLMNIYAEIPTAPLTSRTYSIEEYKNDLSIYLLNIAVVYNKYKTTVFNNISRNFINEIKQNISIL